MGGMSLETVSTSLAFERTSKRRRGFPSETHVKRGARVVHGDKMLLEKLGRKDDAREWLEAGVVVAQAKRDTHALGEIQSALAALED